MNTEKSINAIIPNFGNAIIAVAMIGPVTARNIKTPPLIPLDLITNAVLMDKIKSTTNPAGFLKRVISLIKPFINGVASQKKYFKKKEEYRYECNY